MTRASYYNIPDDAYLFPDISRRTIQRGAPEEEVRQWCAYELIRAYGIHITDLTFEASVKVGSKIYKVDILASRNDSPVLVVECKKRADKRLSKALEQAISYADAQTIRAEYAVATNGEGWLVKRRIAEKWVSIPDMPNAPVLGAVEPVEQFLWEMEELQAVIHGLDQNLHGADASTFFYAMQRFFTGSNILTQGLNPHLQDAAGHVLRVLWHRDKGEHYCFDKLERARSELESFQKHSGAGYPVPQLQEAAPLWRQFRPLGIAVKFMFEGSEGLHTDDSLLLRLLASLLEQGEADQDKPSSQWTVIPNVHLSLRDYLTVTLKQHLHLALPDRLDEVGSGDLRLRSEAAWKTLAQELAEDFPSLLDYLRALAANAWGRISGR